VPVKAAKVRADRALDGELPQCMGHSNTLKCLECTHCCLTSPSFVALLSVGCP
jgi:hypothetical protein